MYMYVYVYNKIGVVVVSVIYNVGIGIPYHLYYAPLSIKSYSNINYQTSSFSASKGLEMGLHQDCL